MKRKTIALTVLASASLGLHAKEDQSSKTPNIIVIYCDDLGYGDLGITGHPDIKTPNLDKMALEGIRFTNYYSASPASTASRYSLMTGKYPIRSGFRWVLNPDSERGIHPKERTMAEAMKDAGYKTAMYGKWHLGSTKKEYLPKQNGFDEFVGLPYSNDMIPPKYPDIALMCGNDTLEVNPDQSKLTALYTQKTIEFINKNKDDNFFIYLPYAMPHTPLYPGEKFLGTSKRGLYGDVVQEIDWSVGEILKALEKAGVDENTLVWFMSDNGPWLLQNENGGSAGIFRDGKGSTWEGGVRVPCIAYWKGYIAPNQINEEIINAMDVYATNISLSGEKVHLDQEIDGYDISSYLFNDTSINVKDKNVPHFYYGLNNELMAVRKENWKLHVKTYSQLGGNYFNGKTPLLFDIYIDPSEKYDLSDKYPEIVLELSELIEKQNEKIKNSKILWD